MNDLKKLLPDEKHLSAVDLRKLPADERSAILGAQAALAEDLYRGDRQLTDFEAFGEEDLHGDGPTTEEGCGLACPLPFGGRRDSQAPAGLVVNLDAIGRLPLRITNRGSGHGLEERLRESLLVRSPPGGVRDSISRAKNCSSGDMGRTISIA